MRTLIKKYNIQINFWLTFIAVLVSIFACYKTIELTGEDTRISNRPYFFMVNHEDFIDEETKIPRPDMLIFKSLNAPSLIQEMNVNVLDENNNIVDHIGLDESKKTIVYHIGEKIQYQRLNQLNKILFKDSAVPDSSLIHFYKNLSKLKGYQLNCYFSYSDMEEKNFYEHYSFYKFMGNNWEVISTRPR